LHESLSAFANQTGGGVLLFGLNESSDFAVVGVADVHRLQGEITHLASSEMEPILRPHFLVDEVDGETVMVAEIDEVPAAQKPCFYKEVGPSSQACAIFTCIGGVGFHAKTLLLHRSTAN
jgi:ATP-dependent DNA helicase RecG